MEDGSDRAAYVRVAAALHGLDLSAAELERVTAAFALVCRFAAPALAWPVPAECEAAPQFRA
ncbi:AtzG-like protein [Acidisoma sp. C75]